MTTVVISAHNVVNAPDVGGHFWVFMQYAQGLMRAGCDVYWMERFRDTPDRARDAAIVRDFMNRMQRFGLGERVILYTQHQRAGIPRYEMIGMLQSKAEKVFRNADLLLNFNYSIDPELLSRFRRTALVDIDPGLLQFWISVGQLVVPEHDLYFTTGETVGRPSAMFSDCGMSWVRIRPPVCLDVWPYMPNGGCGKFTTVSSWWGGCGQGEFITDGKDIFYENNKRVTFLDYVELPRISGQPLELALCMGSGESDAASSDERQSPPLGVPAGSVDRHPYVGDAEDRKVLESFGWSIRLAQEVARTPESYQSYIQGSRGEFSCAKPSCSKFQNAWVSDRTLCYMASGRPAIVQDTGPSDCLPNGLGMFRFSSLAEAAHALAVVDADYARHCRAAREIVEAYFDSRKVSERILNSALSLKMRSGQRDVAAAPIEIELSNSNNSADATTRLMAETLQDGLETLRGAPVRIDAIVRQFFEDSSSFTTERLRARLDDGEEVNVFFKDLNPQNQIEAARLVRSEKMDRGLREIQMYTRVLSSDCYETAKLYASRWEPYRSIHWLFLEYVGPSLKKATEPALWRAAAQWAARFHAKVRSIPAAQTDFLPRYDRAHYWLCAHGIQGKLPHIDPEDRPVIHAALEHFTGSIDRLLALPQSVIHGEYYGHNVLIRRPPPDCQVTAIDWESAAIGPSFFDLASLSAGKWTYEQKLAMRRAYFDEYQSVSGERIEWAAFTDALFDLNVYQALVWLAWWPDRNFSRHFGRWMRELERIMHERHSTVQQGATHA
jgi:aminoglycoside phosphotransferase (APT) family kinase protein